ncbi:MAG: glutathione S-transferase N-terminal domain-containing protein, partial [Candidatus Puniceispirillaceae bacterium]
MAHVDPTPIFWSFRRCPYAMRARLAIAASGQKVQLREILLRDKPADFLATSPKGTVPVLKLENGQVIDESRDIMFWALGQNDPENWLAVWRRNPALAMAFLNRLDGAFKHDLDRYKYASRYDRDAGSTHRDSGGAFLAELDQDLQQTGVLSGAQLGLLDFASLPFVRQFRIADPDWFDNQSWPHLHAWL